MKTKIIGTIVLFLLTIGVVSMTAYWAPTPTQPVANALSAASLGFLAGFVFCQIWEKDNKENNNGLV